MSEAQLQGLTYHPAFGAMPARYRLQELSDDPYEQVVETIEQMKQAALQDASHPLIKADAINAGRTPEGVWRWVKSLIDFKTDASIAADAAALSPSQKNDVVEVLIRPVDIARMRRQGKAVEDCDGFSTYAASLLLASGIPCSFVTVAADGSDPSRFSHVYLAAYPAKGRMALDCSHGAYAGWECPHHKIQEWPVVSSGHALATMLLVGALAWGIHKWL